MTTIRARRLSSNLRGAVLASLLALAGLSAAQAADGASAPATSPASAASPASASTPKVLRYAFRVAETGFDPAKVSDLYSRMVTPHMFEGLYTYDQLARPAKMKPLTAAALPESADDYKLWTVKLRPGIYFSDDPAFKGRRRELTAEDYVYTFKRFADPAVASPSWSEVEELELLGLNEYHVQVRKPASPSTTTSPSRACGRWTATRCSSGPRRRGRA